MLPRQERLTRNGEFREVRRRGRRYTATGLVVYFLAGRAVARVGFRIPRRVGTAVVRNRVRRLLREAYRQLRAEACAGDYVVIAREESAGMGILELREALREVLKKAEADAGN
ncbi:MAG: ribonuclease P protein component [Bacillota bacterium]|nr:ribonuclease P protein component [Bacillota bacterium]